jgi:hypothetical protein
MEGQSKYSRQVSWEEDGQRGKGRKDVWKEGKEEKLLCVSMSKLVQ